MKLSTYFIDFLHNIRLTSNQASFFVSGHKTLRDRLEKDEILANIILTTFLQGSYSRYTAIRPKGDERSDVDLNVVTKLDTEEYTPDAALKLFKPFLDEHYENKYEIRNRSIRISLKNVDLDIVVTSTPSESEKGLMEKIDALSDFGIEKSEDNITGVDFIFKSNFLETFAMKKDLHEWKTEPLYMADRELEEWKSTHPLEQIKWTIEKNNNSNGHYVNVVKALKWWRKVNNPNEPPKSYPLEHFIGNCCPDNITSVAEGITRTLKNMASIEDKPCLYDHGVGDHDVFERITTNQYEKFQSEVCKASIIAREALNSSNNRESALKWKELFGSKFPDPPKENENNGFTNRTVKTSNVPGGKFA